MQKTVSETARAMGVSVRTLHYYDEIGLLHPSSVSEAGYRFYDEEALRLLQQILFFRELQFPLREIQQILSNPDYDEAHVLREHRALLLLRRQQLDGLLEMVDAAIGGTEMKEPNVTQENLQAAKSAYAEEARTRWGHTDAYREWAERQPEPDQAGAEELFRLFGAAVGKDPGDPAVQALVRRWQDHITAHYYTCTKEILAGLGQMYLADARFTASIDRFGPGAAKLMHDAIAIYCGG